MALKKLKTNNAFWGPNKYIFLATMVHEMIAQMILKNMIMHL